MPATAYDSAWLLALFKRRARRPASDNALTDAQIYTYLTIAQELAVARIATVKPEVMYGPRTLMQTADGGLSYFFGQHDDNTLITPMGHVEVYRSATAAEPMRPGAAWDVGAEYVHDGEVIRFPGGRQRTFADGPYFRGVLRPGAIDATSQPSLKPVEARILIVDFALIEWATEDGGRDPEPFRAALRLHWSGDPQDASDTGILGRLKTMNAFDGAAAAAADGAWWRRIDTGAGYVADV